MTAEPIAVWRDDVRGARVRAALREHGIVSVLIKGSGFHAVFPTPGPRARSADCDLLIAPSTRDPAEAVLRSLGFHPLFLASDAMDESGSHASTWSAPDDDFQIDLHHTLPELTGAPEHLWRTLQPHLIEVPVGGQATLTLDRTAAALLAAVHAAHHTRDATKPLGALELVLATLAAHEWSAVTALARELDAVEPLSAALGLVPGGETVREQQGLPQQVEVARRMRLDSADWGATVLADLRDADGLRHRIGIVRTVLAPTPTAMRTYHPGLARRGRRGLAVAYVLRPLRLLVRLPRSLAVLARYRRGARRPERRRARRPGAARPSTRS